MRTLAILCFLVVMLGSQRISATQYSLTDFTNHLSASETRYVQLAPSDANQALREVAVNDLAQAMTIAAQLFHRRELSAQKAAEDIMTTFTNGFRATISIPLISGWVNNVCKNLQFPFPDVIRNEPENERFMKRMNKGIPTMCEALGRPSSAAAKKLAAFQEHLDDSQTRFMTLAPTDPATALRQAAREDLNDAMTMGAELFHAGIRTAKLLSEDILDTFTDGLQATLNVPAIRSWTQGVCAARQFPFPKVITNNPETERFRIRMNRKLEGMCNALSLTYGK